MRRFLVVVFVLALVVITGWLVFEWNQEPASMPAPVPSTEEQGPRQEIIGRSVEGRTIEAYSYGNSPTHLLFVGGIHGGYEWNSVLLAYRVMDYLDANPGVLPAGLMVSIIPSLNPDGVYQVTGESGRFTASDVSTDQEILAAGRFNRNGVDLNRNFDCKWQPTSRWQGREVSAGAAPFSEPEAKALRDFIWRERPAAVVFWHSQANAVYASECEEGILPETLVLMTTYAEAADYRALESFEAYTITGDAEGWLASIGIPAITVELSTHEALDWEQNLAGVKALFRHYTPTP